jgi:hypothetical protein
MTEQQRSDEEVEGHGRPKQDAEAVGEDEVEGHRLLAQEEGSADDVAGHRYAKGDEGDEGDDVGGHMSTRS